MKTKRMAFIGLDLGTTGLKAVGLDEEGVFASLTERAEYTQNGPRIESDGDALYDKVARILRGVAEKLPEGDCWGGVCISSASGNTLLIGQDGRPCTPVISWRDSRHQQEARPVIGDMDLDGVYRLVGWPFSGGMTLAHLSWLAVHEADLLKNASMACMSADYINYRLTGQWAVDHSTATTSFLQNQTEKCWHQPFLQGLGLSEDRLPRLRETGSLLGGLTPAAAQATGLAQGTPVYLGSFDHPSAARGAGVLRPGELLLSCGTSWVCFVPWADREKLLGLGMLCDPFLSEQGIWAGMRALSAVAVHIEEALRAILPGAADLIGEFNALAASCPAGAEGLLLNPLKLPAPQWLAAQNPRHVARALMEGTAYLLRRDMDDFIRAGMSIDAVTMVGGPSPTELWPQIVCDILGKPIKTVNGAYAGAVGAAMIAGVSAGAYGDIETAVGRIRRTVVERVPDAAKLSVYEEGYRRFLRGEAAI